VDDSTRGRVCVTELILCGLSVRYLGYFALWYR
jgi:hypothetical protein